METKVKLSIVIPVYNAEKFILKSYNSIIDQKLLDFEIIYVENNSKDSSSEIITQIVDQDKRVRIIYQKKQGAAAARNLGIIKALGEFIYVFDVDDEIYPNALNEMINVLEANIEVDAVFGKMVKSSKGIEETAKPVDETGSVEIFEAPYWGLKWFEDLSTVVGPPAFLYRKSVFQKIGAYNENLVICEDTAFDIKLGMTSTVAHLHKYVYLYFKHEQSIFQQSKSDTNQIFILWSRLVKSHLPFYLENEVPLKYKELLFKQMFSSMAKLIVFTKTKIERKEMLNTIELDVKPYKMPTYIKFYLKTLVRFPNQNLLKIYVYYISPNYVNRNMKNF